MGVIDFDSVGEYLHALQIDSSFLTNVSFFDRSWRVTGIGLMGVIGFDSLGEYLHALQSDSSDFSKPDKANRLAVPILDINTRQLVGGF